MVKVLVRVGIVLEVDETLEGWTGSRAIDEALAIIRDEKRYLNDNQEVDLQVSVIGDPPYVSPEFEATSYKSRDKSGIRLPKRVRD